MSEPAVLVAHERGAVRQVVARVLQQEGFVVTAAATAEEMSALLEARAWGGLVLDVALGGAAPWSACERARALVQQGRGARAVVLVASVYRSTSYKRRPTSLYGADDYVELHHVGDALPAKLRRALGLAPAAADPHLDAGEALRREGDLRLSEQAAAADLARLIVADVILYNGDRIVGAEDLDTAERAIASDLASARELFVQLARPAAAAAAGDPIGAAFEDLMRALGRRRKGTT